MLVFMKLALFMCFICFSSGIQAAVFVFGDAFISDGTGDLNSPASGGSNNGNNANNAGNETDAVYRADTGDFGNPFNSGMPGGSFSPLAVGNFSGNDYRSTLSFDLSGFTAAPSGFKYEVTSVELFLEVSSVNEIDGADAILDIYTNQGIITGALADPETSIVIQNDTSLDSNFLPGINLSTGSVDLNNPSNFLITLDIADPADGIRLGSGLSTSTFPNQGINGTNFVQVAPRLVVNADLVAIPEPSTLSLLSLLGMLGMTYRRRK